MSTTTPHLDLIGDIQGHAEELKELQTWGGFAVG